MAAKLGSASSISEARSSLSLRNYRIGSDEFLGLRFHKGLRSPKGEADMLVCAALSTGVHRRCCHGCCQKDSMSTFIWTNAAVATP
jgi:hypothetical protein